LDEVTGDMAQVRVKASEQALGDHSIIVVQYSTAGAVQ